MTGYALRRCILLDTCRGASVGVGEVAAGAMLGVISETSAQDSPAHRRRDAGHRWEARRRYAAWLTDLHADSGHAVRTTDRFFVIANPVGEEDARELDAMRETCSERS